MHKTLRVVIRLVFIFAIAPAFSFAADNLNPHYKFSGVKTPKSPIKNTWGAYQTDLFAGSFSYDFKIDLPPGTNGLQPNLSISYNSHAAKGKAGWVGAGWEIPLSYIQRNINYTRKDTSDDKFELYLEGAKHELVYVASEGRFHTKNESYMKIEKKTGAPNERGEYWVATAKDGTEYRFGYSLDSENMINASDTTFVKYVWRWSLDRIRDSNGNCIYFIYSENPAANDRGAVYLSRIEYNNEKKRIVEFVLEAPDKPDMYLTIEQGSELREARRLSEIQVKVSGALVRTYRLGYAMNEGQNRSLLAAITEFGTDGVSSLPPIRFGYEALNKSFGPATSWATPAGDWYLRKIDGDSDLINDVFDVNGDGYPDLVKYAGGNNWDIYFNNKAGTGFSTTAARWVNPTLVAGEEWEIRDIQTYIPGQDSADTKSAPMDFNRDGYVDYIRAHETTTLKIAYNDGSAYKSVSSWPLAASMSVREVERPDNAGNPNVKRTFVDMDGDGMPDMVRRESSTLWRIWRNTGVGFEYVSGWSDWTVSHANGYIEEFEGDDNDTESVLMDVNGDGLPDIVWGRTAEWLVYLNTGSNFLAPANWQASGYTDDDLVNVDGTGNVEAQLLDIDGDGLPDIANPIQGTSLWDVYMNQGGRFGPRIQWAAVFTDGYTSDIQKDTGNVKRDVLDIDGDGLPDIVRRTSNGWEVYKNLGGKQDLLAAITNSLGGKTTISYESSTKHSNTRLPFNYWVVTSVTENNGMTGQHALSSTTNYSYAQGIYDFPTREFRGFGQVTETRADGSKVSHYYHQDEAKKGKKYRTEIKSTADAPYAKTENTFSESVANSVYVSNLARTDEVTFDGIPSNPKTVRKDFQSYDVYGNAGLVIDYGDFNAAGDETYTYNVFAYNPNLWIVDKPSRTSVRATPGGSLLRDTFFYYDDASLGSPPIKGNLTKEERYLSTGSPITTHQYDSFGNRIQTTDPEGRVSRTEYDPSFNTFPVKSWNEKNQLTQKEVDPASGEVTKVIDPNGYTTTYVYDTFKRKIREVKPYDSDASPTLAIEYRLDGIPPESVVIYKKDGTPTYDTVQVIDGFGKLIQTKAEYERDMNKVAIDVFYDEMGRVKRQSNPYLTDSRLSYSPPTTTVPAISYGHDAVGRPTLITNPDGTQIRRTFDHWTVTETDENGHTKSYTFDADQRLTQVVEKNRSASYTTTYQHSPLGELTRITDHLGNVTAMQYDTLGRKTRMIDPDLGTWTYGFDKVGNLTSQTDAKGVKTTIQFDPLNRKIKVDYPNSPDVTYTYDSPTIGTLSKVSDAAGTVTYNYDQRLRRIEETRSMDSLSWTTKWAYDAMDRILAQTYPDGQVIALNHSAQGNLASIPGIAPNFNYSASGHVTKKSYANGRTTTYSYYDQNQRLKSIESPSGLIQSYTYTYDNAGNIKSVTDSIYATTEAFSYDDLDRLTDAGDGQYSIQYQYDAVGNMLSMTKDGKTTAYSYGSSTAQPHAVKGATAPFPVVGSFVIDNGNAVTTTNRVVLNNVSMGNPLYYMASEDSSFAGAEWKPYSAAPVFLLKGFGTKTVYFKVLNGDGESSIKKDSIEFRFTPESTMVDTDGDGLSDFLEFMMGTDATNRDTDGDGLSDDEEVLSDVSEPDKQDTDGDGLNDGEDPFPDSTYHMGLSEHFLESGNFNEGAGRRTSQTYAVVDYLGDTFGRIVAGQSGRIIAEPNIITYEMVAVGDLKQVEVRITNAGRSLLSINTVSISDNAEAEFSMPTESCSGARLESLSSCKIVVRFSPASGGVKSAFLLISSNDPVRGSLSLPIFAASTRTHTLQIIKRGSGDGKISTNVGSITWVGGTGTAQYYDGTIVTLTALPSVGSTFEGWSGACAGTGTCQITMNSSKDITATFTGSAQERRVCSSCSYSSIQQAVDASSGGDIIKVSEGVYYENVVVDASKNLTISCGWDESFSYQTKNPAATVLDGDSSGDGTGDGSVVEIRYAGMLSLENCCLRNGRSDWGGGLRVGSGAGAQQCVLRNVFILANEAAHGGGVGVKTSGSGSVTISMENSIVAGNRSSRGGGLFIETEGVGNTTTANLMNVTITDNEADFGGGLFATSTSSGTTSLSAQNSIVWGNVAKLLGIDIYLEGSAATVLATSYSDLGEIAGDTSNHSEGHGNVTIDPIFLNPALSDYRLHSDSPVIDKGSATGAPSTDYEGQARAGLPDMGADEHFWTGYEGIQLLSLTGGERIPVGSAYNITWSAPAQAMSFKVKYSTDGGSTWRLLGIVNGARHFRWDVPFFRKNLRRCLVMVIGYIGVDASGTKIGADKSERTFSIEGVSLLTPNGPEHGMTSGVPYTITWQTSPALPVSAVQLKYTLNNGVTWKPVPGMPISGNPGSFEWTPPTVAKTKKNCKIKVILKDASGRTIGSDTSDAAFAISP